MKKIKLLPLAFIIAICLLTTNVFSQTPYVSVNLGYGLATSTQNFGTSNQTSTNRELVNVSFGQGLNFGATFGYMFNKNIGAELGISYLLGAKTTMNHTFTSGITDYTMSAKMLRFNPTIVIASGFDVINPYAKFGFVLGSGSITEEQNYVSAAGNVDYTKTKLNGGMAFGFTASIGAMYNLSKNMAIFGELSMLNMSYAPTTGEITEATHNGADQLASMTTNDKQITFVDSYNPSVSIPSSQPDQQLKTKTPFGSFGINIGVRIGF